MPGLPASSLRSTGLFYDSAATTLPRIWYDEACGYDRPNDYHDDTESNAESTAGYGHEET